MEDLGALGDTIYAEWVETRNLIWKNFDSRVRINPLKFSCIGGHAFAMFVAHALCLISSAPTSVQVLLPDHVTRPSRQDRWSAIVYLLSLWSKINCRPWGNFPISGGKKKEKKTKLRAICWRPLPNKRARYRGGFIHVRRQTLFCLVCASHLVKKIQMAVGRP